MSQLLEQHTELPLEVMELLMRFALQMLQFGIVEPNLPTRRFWAKDESKPALIEEERREWFKSLPPQDRLKPLSPDDTRAKALIRWIGAVGNCSGQSSALRILVQLLAEDPIYQDRKIAITVARARMIYADLYLLDYVGRRFCPNSPELEKWCKDVKEQIRQVRAECRFGGAS